MTRMKTTAEARDRHRTRLSLDALRRPLISQERHEWDLLHDADLAAELEAAIASHNDRMKAVPTLSSNTPSAPEGLRFLAHWFDVMYDEVGKSAEVQQDLRRWAAEREELEAENARLRGALTAIEDCQVDCRCPPECCGCEEREMKRIATTALAPQPAPEAKP